jgi:pyruvate dehydrogenase E1 component alpha subunit
MFAELLGKEAGYCRGKGGSMHIADPDSGNLGANAIVGGSAGIATGAAFSAKMRGSGQVAACFFGEGALGQGLLYEVMNMASLWKQPVQRIYTLRRSPRRGGDRPCQGIRYLYGND